MTRGLTRMKYGTRNARNAGNHIGYKALTLRSTTPDPLIASTVRHTSTSISMGARKLGLSENFGARIAKKKSIEAGNISNTPKATTRQLNENQH